MAKRPFQILSETVDNEIDFDFNEFELPGGETVSRQFGDTDLPIYSYKLLEFHLVAAYNTRKSLLVYGDPGLGKSSVVKHTAKNIAKGENRKFIEWNNLSIDEKKELIKNPSGHFCLIDIRTAQMEPTDLVGIPDISSTTQFLETKIPKWIYLMTQPGSAGILFLDELNQGSPQVLKALYEVVLDRSAGGVNFQPGWGIAAAGNLGMEFGNEPIPQALTNRFLAGVLVADPQSWFEYAEASNIETMIINFVRSRPDENFYTKPANESDPFPTPRAMEMLSDYIKNVKSQFIEAKKRGNPIKLDIYQVIETAAGGFCGLNWARKFITFVKHFSKLDWLNLVKDPDQIKKLDLDKLYAILLYIRNNVQKYFDFDGKQGNLEIYQKGYTNAAGQHINVSAKATEVARVLSVLQDEMLIVLANQLNKNYKNAFFNLFGAMKSSKDKATLEQANRLMAQTKEIMDYAKSSNLA